MSTQRQTQSHNLSQRAAQVVEHHRNPDKPGKPLFLVIPGAVVAILALAIIGLAIYDLDQSSLSQGTALALIIPAAVIYIGSVFCFALGWEVYNLKRAAVMTLIIVVITVLIIFIAAALVAVLGALGSGAKGGHSSHSSHSSHSGGTTVPHAAGGVALASAPHPVMSQGLPPFIFLGSGGSRRTIVNNVTTPITCPNCHQPFTPVAGQPLQCPHCHAVLEAHMKPVTCPFCEQPYVPQDHDYRCPNCNAPTPPELLVGVAGPPPATKSGH